jgi:acyl-CoA synthetase (AMP-forming)/AMP-acid ligase II
MAEKNFFTIREQIFNGNQDPVKNAIESPGYQPLTFRDLRLQVLFVVKYLNTRGFHRNDRIAIITPSGPETAVCIIAVMAGFTAVPLNPQNKIQEYEDIFFRTGIKAIIVQKGYETAAIAAAKSLAVPVIELIPSFMAGKFDLNPVVPTGLVEPDFAIASDTAYVLLTSGTTSESKVVTKTQKQSALGKQRTCIYQKITPADRCLHIMPYYHGMGVGAPLMSPLITGATVICTKDFIPSDFIDLLRVFLPTYFSAGPALIRGILRELKKIPPDQLKNHSLRYIRSSSGFLPEDLSQELEAVLGVPVIDSYGMSETGLVSINLPPKRGSVGIPVIGSLAVIDEKGEVLKPLSVGEIIIKDPGVFSDCENASGENNSAFISGWFRTGDLGYLDDEGYLFLTGRKKEIINKGGEKISPSEIDAVLKGHPKIRDAMTFAISEPVLGEDIAAMVVAADERITETELRMFLHEHLIQFKVPRRIYFVDEIPKTPTGKPQRYLGTQKYSENPPK